MVWVQIPALTPYVGLLQEVFLHVLRFSPLLKNQHFLIPIQLKNFKEFFKKNYFKLNKEVIKFKRNKKKQFYILTCSN